MVGGLALATAAAAMLVLHLGDGAARQAEAPASSESGFPVVGTASDTYLPGHSSGWHVHPGLHSVVVLGGTLTVYDESCAPTTFGAGETYLGGFHPPRARNETVDVLDVAITYIYEGAASGEPQGTGLLRRRDASSRDRRPKRRQGSYRARWCGAPGIKAADATPFPVYLLR